MLLNVSDWIEVVMGLFGLFAKPDPVQQHARRFAKLFVALRRKYPDRSLREALKPATPALRMMMPAASAQRQLLDLITSDEYQVNSVAELCCAVVAMLTDTPPDASEKYQHVVRTVQAELDALGYVETA